MKEKFYIFLVVVVLLLSTGCTAQYNIEIYNDEVIEDFTIIEEDSSKFDSIFNNSDDIVEGSEGSSPVTYREAAKRESKEKTPVLIQPNGVYYKKDLINKKNKLGIKYKHTFKINEYDDSNIVNSFYNHFSLYSDKDLYILSTLGSTYPFDQFPIIQTIQVKVKTNHVVLNNNADEVDGFTYIWNIDKNNCKDKKIYLELYKDKYVFNYEGRLTKILYISIGLAILIIIAIIFFKRKATNNNRV